MAATSASRRKEKRTALKVLVELYSFDNASFEITSTINVSKHGARVLSRTPWKANQRVSVRMLGGKLNSQARVTYCEPFGDQKFLIGLETKGLTEFCSNDELSSIST